MILYFEHAFTSVIKIIKCKTDLKGPNNQTSDSDSYCSYSSKTKVMISYFSKAKIKSKRKSMHQKD